MQNLTRTLKNLLVILLILQSAFVSAQTFIDSTLFKTVKYFESNLLVGKWESIDSVKYRIEFIESKYELELIAGKLANYHFPKDSLNNVSSSGYIANWPPYDCDLSFVDAETLQITFSQVGEVLYIHSYRKVE